MSVIGLNILKLSAILFLVGGGIIAVSKDLKQVLFANKKKLFFHLFITVLLFFIAGVFTIRNLITEPLISNTILVQIWIFGGGVIHVWLGNKNFKWDEDNKKSLFFIFTLIFAIIGSVVLLFTASWLGPYNLHFFFWSGIILFFLPYFLGILIDSVFDIPTPIIDKWYFPEKSNIVRPDKQELRNPILITLEIMKYAGGPISRIKAKAPENMPFGRFFYHFINDYNMHNPEKQIAIQGGSGNNYGWGFYIKSNFLLGWKSVNTEHTILTNRLSENQLIVCERFEK